MRSRVLGAVFLTAVAAAACSSSQSPAASRLSTSRASSRAVTVPSGTGVSPSDTAPAFTLPAPSPSPSPIRPGPVAGTVHLTAQDAQGHAMAATLTMHQPIPLQRAEQAGVVDAYGCTTVALGDSSTAGVIPFSLAVTNTSRGGFPLPDEDQIAFTVVGPVDVWVVGGDPTGEFCATSIRAGPAESVSGYVLVNGFKTPNQPSGDYSVLASHLALFAAVEYSDPHDVLMPVTACASGGIINVQHIVDRSSGVPGGAGEDVCAFT
jgi:hypothetical protein